MSTSTILSDNGVSSGTSGIKTSGGNDGTLVLQTTTAGGAATTAVTIDTNQNLGVNCTPSNLSGFTYLEVKGKTTNSGGIIKSTSANGTYAVQMYTASAEAYLYTDQSIPLCFYNGGAEVARLTTGGNLVLKGGTTSANGTGITFPATQSASTDANTLDDYEEGTWTPTLYGASSAGTTTYDGQTGWYTKIGRQVTVTAIVGATATTGTGELRFGGLPFTCNSTISSFTTPWVSSVNWGGGTYLSVVVNTNTTTCEVVYLADDAAQVNQQITNETQSWRFTVTYFV